MLKKILYIGLTLILLVSTLTFTTGCDKQGELYSLETAYEEGFFTVEDLEQIKEYKVRSKRKWLSKKESLEIRTEFAEKMGKALGKEMTAEDVGLTYYGKIKGYKILEVAENSSVIMLPAVYYEHKINIGGVEFEMYHGLPYLTWHVWKS